MSILPLTRTGIIIVRGKDLGENYRFNWGQVNFEIMVVYTNNKFNQILNLNLISD